MNAKFNLDTLNVSFEDGSLDINFNNLSHLNLYHLEHMITDLKLVSIIYELIDSVSDVEDDVRSGEFPSCLIGFVNRYSVSSEILNSLNSEEYHTLKQFKMYNELSNLLDNWSSKVFSNDRCSVISELITSSIFPKEKLFNNNYIKRDKILSYLLDNSNKYSFDKLENLIPREGHIEELISTCNYILYRLFNDGDEGTYYKDPNFIPLLNLMLDIDKMQENDAVNLYKLVCDTYRSKFNCTDYLVEEGNIVDLFINGLSIAPIKVVALILITIVDNLNNPVMLKLNDYKTLDLRSRDTLETLMDNQW